MQSCLLQPIDSSLTDRWRTKPNSAAHAVITHTSIVQNGPVLALLICYEDHGHRSRDASEQTAIWELFLFRCWHSRHLVPESERRRANNDLVWWSSTRKIIFVIISSSSRNLTLLVFPFHCCKVLTRHLIVPIFTLLLSRFYQTI